MSNVYDMDGKKAFDFNRYYGEFNHFENGKLEVIRTIETGTKYRVIIDKTGKVISDEEIQ